MPPKNKGKKIAFGPSGTYNRTTLRAALKRAQESQEEIRERIKDAMPEYLTRSAENREEYLERGGKVLKKKTRADAARKLRDAQQDWEDFFFYQNEVNRWKRRGCLRPTPDQEAQAQQLNKQPMLIHAAGDDHDDYLRCMLNHYDKRNIGTPQHRYRQGELRDGNGEASTDPEGILLEPEDLHLFTPVWRRVPFGLRELSVTRKMQQAMEVPLQIRVNEEAIDKFRGKWDNALNKTAGVEYRTHTERRIAEREAYEHIRPSTANISVRSNKNGGQIDDDRFHSIQTTSGVFITALESSHDWLTSYDCLGLVKNCGIPEHLETSAVRDEDRFYGSPGEDEDLDEPFDPPSDEMDGDNDGGKGQEFEPAGDSSSQNLAATSEEEPDDTGRELRSGKQLSSSPMPKAKRVKRKPDATQANTVSKGAGDDAAPVKGMKKKGASKPAAKEGTEGPTEDESRKKVTARIDYPYNKREFCLPKKTRRVNEGRLPSTMWAEATDGRRERHVGMAKAPFSPVNSPPHSPIVPDTVDMSTIPDGNDLPNEPKLRRCKHGNTTCRAWWTHATDECWALPEEPTSLPTSRMDIDAPVLLDVPEGSRKTYHGRLHDHYGRMILGKVKWPRIGIRVPYEPTTLTPAENVKHMNAPLQGWRSLAVPVIEKALHEKNQWNSDPDPTDSGDEYDEGDEGESDDEDDLFRISYEQGSFPNGRPAPVIPPTIAPAPTAPDDTATASAATEAIAPAEDDEVGDDAEDL